MKIFEYNTIFGTLSWGFENSPGNEVVEIANFTKKDLYAYNMIHKKWFGESKVNIGNYVPTEDFDLAVMRPDITKIKGGLNPIKHIYKVDDIWECTKFLRRTKPKFAIIQAPLEVMTFFNSSESSVTDGFGNFSMDKLAVELADMGYKPHILPFLLQEHGFAAPHKFVFYIATPMDFEFKAPPITTHPKGRRGLKKCLTVRGAIGDLAGEDYQTLLPPQNAYQKIMRRTDIDRTTWHEPIQENPNKRLLKDYDELEEGEKYNQVRKSVWNKPMRTFNSGYIGSGNGCEAIHPIKSTKYTIRETCRLLGHPDALVFSPLEKPKKPLTDKIFRCPSPLIGQMLMKGFGQ